MAAARAARRSSTASGLARARTPPVEVATRLLEPAEGEEEELPATVSAFSTLEATAVGLASGCAASIVRRAAAAASSLEASPKWTAYLPASVKSSLPKPEKLRSIRAMGRPSASEIEGGRREGVFFLVCQKGRMRSRGFELSKREEFSFNLSFCFLLLSLSLFLSLPPPLSHSFFHY